MAVIQYTHTDIPALVSLHLSFDNKNTSLKLSAEHQTKKGKGNGIKLHALGEA